MDVEGVGGVDAGHPGQGAAGVGLLERSEVSEIEDRPEVDIEALGPLTGEDREPDDALIVGQCRTDQIGGVVRESTADRRCTAVPTGPSRAPSIPAPPMACTGPRSG